MSDAEAIARVRALHKQAEDTQGFGVNRIVVGLVCSHCSTGDPYCTVSEEWPCPTIRALDGVKPEDG